jgi:hypothetical protein
MGCVFCSQHERVEHLFLLCPFARAVWVEVKRAFPLKLTRKDLTHSKQWVFDFLRRENSTAATVLAVTCWHIWQARNDVRNNEVNLHPSRVASKVLAYVDMIATHLFKKPGTSRSALAVSRPRWKPPPPGITCVNVDAALFAAER